MRDKDPKSQPPNDENDDDLNWDWLNDAEHKDKGDSSEHTGLTGSLSWQDEQIASSGQTGDDPSESALDWQNPTPSGGKSAFDADTGVTGELDWQTNAPTGGGSRASTGLTGYLDWQEDTPNVAASPADSGWDDEDDGPSDSDMNFAAPDDTPSQPTDTGQLLDWMADPEGQFGSPQTDVNDTPDWMMDIDDAPAASSQSSAASVELPSWLADLQDPDVPDADKDDSAQEPQDWSGGTRTPTGFTGYLEEPAEFMPYGIEDEAADDLSPSTDDFDFDAMFAEPDSTPAPMAAASDAFDDEFDLDAILGQSDSDDVQDDIDYTSLFLSDDPEEQPVSQMPAPHQPVKAVTDDIDFEAMFAETDGAVGTDDWLEGFDPDAEQAVAEGEDDFASFFAEADAADTDTDADADYMANMVASSRPTEDEHDWFAAPVEAAPDAEPDWLDALEDISLDDVLEPEPVKAAPAARATPSPKQPEVDLDDLFGDADESPIVPVPDSMDTFDFSNMPELPDEEIPTFAAEENPDVPEWLREAAASTDVQLSAAGIIRQKYQDRPLESLDDRLKALREAGLSLTSASAEAPERRRVLENVLPGVSEALEPGTSLVGSSAALDAALRVTPEQQKNALLLRSLVGHSSAAEIGSSTPRVRRRTLPLARWLVAALLLIAVTLPFFVPALNISEQPAAVFAPGSTASNAFVRIATLPAGAPVLVAAEYGPTGAAELDPLLRATLMHILSKGARPILLSTNPIGLTHAKNILFDLAGEQNQGRAYDILGYQPGSLLGLRNLDANSSSLLPTDIQGGSLALRSLDDVSLAVIVAENAESVQTWLEQTRVGKRVPVIIASSAAALPLIVPYTQQGQVAGLLTGYRDAVTYTKMLAAQGAVTIALPDRPTPVILPTALPITPTVIPPTVVPVVTQEITAEATVQAAATTEAAPTEVIATTTDIPATATESATTATPETPSATDVLPSATNTPIAAATSSEPTATTEPGLRITPPSPNNTVEVAIIIAQSNVNTRSGPATTFGIVKALAPGAQVRVVSYNEDKSWVQVELADGTQAWIAQFLVAIREVPASEAGPLTPVPPKRNSRPYGQRVSQVGTPVIPTMDASLLLTANALDPSLLLTQAAVLTQLPPLDLTQSAVLTQLPPLDATQSAALTQVPSLDLTQSAVLTQLPPLDATQSAALTQVPGLALTPGAPPTGGETLTLSAPSIANAPERWNATTLGLIVAIIIIIFGNLVAVLRALLRRDR